MGEPIASGTRGWVFFCNDQTQPENLRRNIVGTLVKYLPRFHDLKPGDPVLLYNYESGLLVAYFTAASPPAVVNDADPWSRKYPAQVSVKPLLVFHPPVPRKELERIPDLLFHEKGYLMNFSLPIEVVQRILDLAAGRKAAPGETSDEKEKDFRRRFPPKFLASDGHWARSKAELLIDNWLYTRHLAHAYERRLPVPEDAYADFYVPLGECCIEYWGLDTAEYTERQRRKREIFRKYGLRVIELGEEDLTELDDRLPGMLLRHLPDGTGSDDLPFLVVCRPSRDSLWRSRTTDLPADRSKRRSASWVIGERG